MDVPLQRAGKRQGVMYGDVSILVLMDVPLQPQADMRKAIQSYAVSILVLMDVPLQQRDVCSICRHDPVEFQSLF